MKRRLEKEQCYRSKKGEKILKASACTLVSYICVHVDLGVWVSTYLFYAKVAGALCERHMCVHMSGGDDGLKKEKKTMKAVNTQLGYDVNFSIVSE